MDKINKCDTLAESHANSTPLQQLRVSNSYLHGITTHHWLRTLGSLHKNTFPKRNQTLSLLLTSIFVQTPHENAKSLYNFSRFNLHSVRLKIELVVCLAWLSRYGHVRAKRPGLIIACLFVDRAIDGSLLLLWAGRRPQWSARKNIKESNLAA